MLTLRLMRYLLLGVLLALAVAWVNIFWVFLGGLNASPPWYTRLIAALPELQVEWPAVFKMHRASDSQASQAMGLLATSTAMLVSVALTICGLLWFERKEREAAGSALPRDAIAGLAAQVSLPSEPPERLREQAPMLLPSAENRERGSG